MNTLLQVALGGAIGAVLRYGSVRGVVLVFGAASPVGTMAVNILGSFLMGLAAVWFFERVGDARTAPLFMTGILGGFTTFSAYSLEAMVLWEEGKQSFALFYVFGTVFCAIGALAVGMVLMRSILS